MDKYISLCFNKKGYLCTNILFNEHTMKKQILAAVLPVITTALVLLSWIAAEGGLNWNILLPVLPLAMMTIAIFISGGTKKLAYAKVFAFEVVFPYAWVGICSMAGFMPPHTIIIFLTIAVALGCAKTLLLAAGGKNEAIVADLLPRTLNLYVLFTLLLATGFTLPRYI